MKLVETIGEKCRVCYTCVRDCPAKAIRIANGQAEVIQDRCIGCGNCVRVCSQNAKRVADSIPLVKEILSDREYLSAAIVAPSFPAEFQDVSPEQLVGQLKKIGFSFVCEVAFGADIVAYQYKKLVSENSGKRFIATTCPGVVSYVEKYHPSLVSNLVPIASPMITTARCLRLIHRPKKLKIVFIGPCLAKKAEAAREKDGNTDVDAVLTFAELREMLAEYKSGRNGQSGEMSAPFDPPHPGLGALFPLTGGMLQAAEMKEDLLVSDIVSADGTADFVQAIREFEDGNFDARLLEILCCSGCIMGAGITSEIPYFKRRAAVSSYVRNRVLTTTEAERVNVYKKLSAGLDTSYSFQVDDHRLPLPSKAELDLILAEMGKLNPEDELNCGACGYPTCRDHAVAIHKGLAETEMCLPHTIERLKFSLDELKSSNQQLAETKLALFDAEKLASMGQLSAGIAHEINNPLGIILLNAKVLLDEMGPDSEDYEDLQLIVEQAERCKKIVAGLLNFARKNKAVRHPVNIRELVANSLKGIARPDNVEITTDDQLTDPVFELDKDQIVQVLINLIINAIEAMADNGGSIIIHLKDTREELELSVKDTGPGIPAEYISRIFEPLFTTKQIGKGTGLGLAVTYGIIKMHHGRIRAESNTDPTKGQTGTSFIITLPRQEKQEKRIN